MTERLAVGLVLIACGYALAWGFVAVALATCRAARIGVVSARVGTKPILARIGRLELGGVPLGAFVDFARRSAPSRGSDDAGLAADLAAGRVRYAEDAPAAVLLALACAPLALATAAALGLGAPITEIVSTLGAFVTGALSPTAAAPRTLAIARAALAEGGALRYAGRCCLAVSSVELACLPSPLLFVLALKAERMDLTVLRLVPWLVATAAGLSWFVAWLLWTFG